jgi:hypothetical protein
MPIKLHGKDYLTVVERLKMLFDSVKHEYSMETSFHVENGHILICKAVLSVNGNKYTGHALGDISEGKNKICEATETHAIGRSLSAYGLSGGEFSSAEEIADFIRHENDAGSKKIQQQELTVDSTPFKKGKNAGKAIKDLDENSLKWIIEESTMGDAWKDIANKVLDEIAREQEEGSDSLMYDKPLK